MFTNAVSPTAENRTNNPKEENQDQAVKEAHDPRAGIMKTITAKTGCHTGSKIRCWVLEYLICRFDCEMQLLRIPILLLSNLLRERYKLRFESIKFKYIYIDNLLLSFRLHIHCFLATN